MSFVKYNLRSASGNVTCLTRSGIWLGAKYAAHEGFLLSGLHLAVSLRAIYLIRPGHSFALARVDKEPMRIWTTSREIQT